MIIEKEGLYKLTKSYGVMPKGIYLSLKKGIAGMFEIVSLNQYRIPTQYYSLPVELVKEV